MPKYGKSIPDSLFWGNFFFLNLSDLYCDFTSIETSFSFSTYIKPDLLSYWYRMHFRKRRAYLFHIMSVVTIVASQLFTIPVSTSQYILVFSNDNFPG